MAVNSQNFLPEAPEFARSRPDAYYAWLTSNGFPPQVAYDQTTSIFGKPKSKEEQQADAAKQKQKAEFAQAGGAIGGALLTNEAIKGFPNIGGLFSSSAPTATTTASGTGATTGATTTGATATGTGTAGGMSAGTIGGIAALGAIGINQLWEGGMKDIVRGRGTRADYINTGLMVGTGGIGGLPNLALRLAGKRSIGAMMTSGKSNAQALRDDFRGALKESGVADKDYMVTLADGSKFNIGLDGKTKYKNTDEKTTRNAWDVDFSNPLAKFATDKLDPMIRGIYGADDPKKKFFPGQYTGMLVNAATSNAKNETDVLANIETMLGKSKFAQQAGVSVTPPKPPKPPKGEVVRVSSGMYMNDKGEVGPAKTIKEALRANYNTKSK